MTIPKYQGNEPVIGLKPPTYNAIAEAINNWKQQGGSAGRRHVSGRWCELKGKQIVDDGGRRVVKYSFFEFGFARDGDQSFMELGWASRNYNASDDFADYAINADEVHRSHVKHTGLILSATDFKRKMVWIEGLPTNDAQIIRIFHESLPELFVVDLVQSGGAQGTQTTKPTWTYHVKDEQGLTLNGSNTTPMSPIKPRNVGFYLPATKGLARWNNLQTTIELLEAWEEEDTEAC